MDPFFHLIHVAELSFRANIDKAILLYCSDVASLFESKAAQNKVCNENLSYCNPVLLQ